MDPLYANYDKRKKTLEENSAPVPQPTPNSMPVFGAAAAPTPTVELTPVAEPTPAPTPEPTPAPAVEPVAEPVVEPVAGPVPTIESTLATEESAPAQNPFESQQQPVSFEQQFEQMVDGVAPAQLSEPQPQFNPNYTGTGDIILNLDQPKKKFNTKILAIFGGIFVIVIIAVALIALGGNKSGSTSGGNNKQAVNDFIEYFVYGTEGENEVTDESLDGDPQEFAFAYNTRNAEYESNINNKINSLKNNEELKAQIEAYFNISRILDMSYMLNKYVQGDQIEEDGYGIPELATSIKKYETSVFEYYKALDDNDCIEGGKKDNECIDANIDEIRDDILDSDKQHMSMSAKNEDIYADIIEKVKELQK